MSIHKLADVHPGVSFGKDCTIGPFTTVGPNVVIGEGSYIGSHCNIGVAPSQTHGRTSELSSQLEIGSNAYIRGHSTFYTGSNFQEGLTTGHYVSVREGIDAGPGLQLGSFADLQGYTRIGNYVRIFNGAHICQWSKIGNFVWIFPYVVFTNDPTPPSDATHEGPTVEDYAVIATRTTLLPGVRIGSDALIGANSLVSKDVTSGDFIAGNPARRIGEASAIRLRDKSGPAYPWRSHFKRGFPEEVAAKWPLNK